MKALAQRLAEAREKAAHPLSETWGEAQGILATLASAPDQVDVRMRLRSCLWRIFKRIDLFVLPIAMNRLAAVTMTFTGKHQGRFRTYFICHKRNWVSALFNKSDAGGWAVSSRAVQLPDNLPQLPPDPDRLEENPAWERQHLE
jgi:hypothetical protein